MIILANPIYNVAFKYLIDEERIARTILSALLKKNIIRVEMRPHNYNYLNVQRDTFNAKRARSRQLCSV